MKILIAVGHTGIYSGASHQALYQIAGLRRAGFEVAAVWGDDPHQGADGFERLRALEVPFFILPIDKAPSAESLKVFRRILKDFVPDVVECIKSGAQYHALSAGIGLRRHALVFYRGISRRMDCFQELKYRLRRVDRIIANCFALKRIMSETRRIPDNKIDVVPGEFDPACADPETVDSSGLREELGLPLNTPLITQLGNWSNWRGQDVTLKAAAILKAQGHKFHLLFVGRDTSRLTELVRDLGLGGWVTLAPFRRDPERVLKETAVAVNASIFNESLSGALLNAQAMGVPAVASSLAGNPEIVEDGVTGYIVPARDERALGERLAYLFEVGDEGRRRMGHAARQRMLRLFSAERRTSLRIVSYEKAIAAAKRRVEGR